MKAHVQLTTCSQCGRNTPCFAGDEIGKLCAGCFARFREPIDRPQPAPLSEVQLTLNEEINGLFRFGSIMTPYRHVRVIHIYERRPWRFLGWTFGEPVGYVAALAVAGNNGAPVRYLEAVSDTPYKALAKAAAKLYVLLPEDAAPYVSD